MSPFLLPAAPVASAEEYVARHGGGDGLRRATELGTEATIEEIRRSGLRGRGGGGFLTGRKWAGIAAQRGSRRFVVANGAEGEPGTFKDRALMRANPYQLVEGLVIAAYAVGASEAFVCVKASFEAERERLARAAAELQEAGVCRECQVSIVAGPEEYLFGEEKAMLEVIEGREPLPRLLPPYEHGLFARDDEPNPTLVNNVETLSNVPHVLARGADWFRTMGTAESPGTLVATVVGDVVAPAVAEVELGIPVAEVIDGVGGGVAPGRSVKAVFSGVANPVVTAADLDAPFSYEGLAGRGSALGAGGLIVYDDTACMVEVARLFSRFLYVESCGQCPACKTGSGEITDRLARLEGGAATDRDVEEIGSWLAKVTDGNRCYLAVEEREVVASILRSFPEEFANHIEQRACPRPRPLPLPKIVELGGGTVRYDDRQYAKQPDWTYLAPPTAAP